MNQSYDKMCNTFSDYNQYVIEGWMVNKLQLKGNELVVFALIHAYSQAYGWYMNSQQYTADATGVSKVSANNSLKKLVEKDLLIKEEYTAGMTNSKLCKYKVNILKVQELCEVGSKETLLHSKETYYNNILNNNINNNINNTELRNLTTTKENKDDVIEEMFDKYTENDKLYNTLIDFADYRKDKKSPLTEKAAKLLLGKLDKCSTDEQKIECLQNSIMNGWTGVFPSEDKPKNNKSYHIKGAEAPDTSHRRRH